MKTHLVGYYGMHNLGDDALLMASRMGVTRWMNSEVAVGAYATQDVLGIQANLKQRPRFRGENRLRQYLQALQADQILIGGGSVFHTAQDINIKRHMGQLCGQRRILALGVSLGPFVNRQAELACQTFLNQADFVALRDPQSYAIAKALSPDANLSLTFDLAPSLLVEQTIEAKEKRHGLGVSLCPSPAMTQARLNTLAEQLIRVHRQTGEVLHLLDFNGHPQLGDQPIHQQLMAQLQPHIGQGVKHHPYDGDVPAMLNRFAGFKAVLAMRLHASVFAYMTQTQQLCLSYHPKCDGWCDQIQLHSGYRHDLNQLDPCFLGEQLVSALSDTRATGDLPLEQALYQSLQNWRLSHDHIIQHIKNQMHLGSDYSVVQQSQ